MIGNYEGRTIIADILDACCPMVEKASAIKALRALCRYFGGQLLYIPAIKTAGGTCDELRGVLADAAGDGDAEKMLEKMMALLGGSMAYIPMEKGAFRGIIAREIYERYDGTDKTRRELCREYGISYTQLYRLCEEAKDSKLQLMLDFDEK